MLRARTLLLLSGSLLLVLAMLWGQGCSRPPPPTVGTPVVQPSTLRVNQATLLTVTSRITSSPSHPAVPASVKLERVDAQGTIVDNLGTMYDDGTHGDAGAGDGIFTVQVSLTEATSGTLRLQVAATFRAGPGRVTSAIALVPIVTNTPPVANTGPDQTVAVGTTVQLDGRQSSDVDGDPLTFRWAITSAPAGSLTALSDPTAVQPTLVVDQPGTYTVQLIVNDGTVDSAPASVLIRTQNSPPVANAGPDQTVVVGATVQLDGRQSSDVDGDPLTFRWALTVRPAQSAATLSDPTAAQPTFVADQAGIYVAQLIVNDGQVDSAPATTTITAAMPPQVRLDPADGALLNTATPLITITYQDTGSGIDLTSLRVTLDGVEVTARFTITATQATYRATLADGVHQLVVNLRNLAGLGAQATAQFTIDTIPPPPINQAALTLGPVTNGQVTITGAPGSTEGGALVTLVNTRTGQRVRVRATADGAFTVVLAAQPGDGVTLTSTDAAGNTSAPTVVTVGLPPDPATVAPPLASTVTTTLATATAFLYAGPSPVQTGVAPGTINPGRTTVLRGRVLDASGAPLPGVTLTILNHPEFGQTLSRADGRFDLAVNGGGFLTVTYQRAGLFTAQRQVTVPWQDYVLLPDVVLLPVDPQVTTVDLTASVPMQVARGSVMSDSDGTRQATLLVPQGTQATMVLPNGSTPPLTRLSVRATEFTVGPMGPQTMPAELPSTSAYTYAVVFTADEAKAAGAIDVRFTPPLPFYVENFLRFPAGTPVPLGTYDATRSTWVPAASGLVMTILSITDGLAALDVDGSGQAASATTLASLGITDAERQQLARLYSAGQSLWRVLIPHFDQPWDANWGIFPPSDAVPPTQPPVASPPGDCSPSTPGSIIECTNQTLGEDFPLVGTPFSLHYWSDRVPGRTARRSLTMPLTSAAPPASLAGVEVQVDIAGQHSTQHFPPTANQTTTFTWDGKDVYGRPLQGAQPVHVRIGYTYQGQYTAVPRFGYNGNGVPITGSRSRSTVTLWMDWNGTIGPWQNPGLGGMSITPLHAYDINGHVLYLGNGQRRTTAVIASSIQTLFNGLGFNTFGQALTVSPDGSVYFSDNVNVWKIAPGGALTRFAGTLRGGFSGDGGPAVNADLGGPTALAVGPDGSVYIGDDGNHRVRRVTPDGIINTVAGNGVDGGAFGSGNCCDGSLATQVPIDPKNIAVTPDGTLYIAAGENGIIMRRVTPDGIISSLPSQTAAARAVTVGPDGSIYYQDFTRIFRISPSGTIVAVAGNGTAGFSGDGGPALQAQLSMAGQSVMSVGPDGTLYLADTVNQRIRKVGPDGIIATIAGSGGTGVGAGGFSGDGGPATAARLNGPRGGVQAPDGTLYINDRGNQRIRSLSPLFPGLGAGNFTLPSTDGRELFVFNAAGKHLRTHDTLTGATLYTFAYDAHGLIRTITDVDGNVTTIERDGQGNPTGIVAPFGPRTTLSVDANGYLASITNPAGEAPRLSYTAGGLLATLTDPKGNTSTMTYDAAGRLTQDQNAAGGSQSLTRVDQTSGYTVTRTTGVHRATTYRVDALSTGDQQQTYTFPDGTQTTTLRSTNATTKTTFSDGAVTTLVEGPDPRFNMQAPLPVSVTVMMGGLTANLTTNRTVALTDPTNPLSLTTLTDRVTLNGRTFTSAFNAATKTTTRTSAAGRTDTVTLDGLARVTQTGMGGLLPVTLTYDTRGHLSAMTQGTGVETRTVHFAYNLDGYLQTVTDSLGRAFEYEYDAAGRITRYILPDSRAITYTYDVNGNLTSLIPPGHFAHVFHYTPVDQTAEYVPPDVGAGTTSMVYTYNLDKDLTSIARPDGQVLSVNYDNAGRLSTLRFAPTNQILASYAYQATTGQLTTMTTADGGTLSYTYNGALLTQATWAGAVAGSVGRTYNSDFRVISLTVNGATPIAFQYDADRLRTQAGGLSISRNAQNGLVTGTTLGSVTDSLTYNGFGDVTAYSATFNTTGIFTTQYVYDTIGRITRKMETIGGITDTFDYSYDLAGQLTEVKQNGMTTATYAYDSNGNRLSGPGLSTPPTYDAQDRLLQYGGTTYTYTANGELLTRTTGALTTTYQCDVLGNLTSVALPNGTHIAYVIDGHNRRVGKKVNGVLTQGFLYQDRLEPIAELDGANNIVSRFIYATRRNVPDYMVKDSVTYRLISDLLGSPRLVVNVATGHIAQRMDYDEFGNVTLDTNPDFQPFGFAGGIYDQHTRLVRFGARDYNAETGRWTAQDPILFQGRDTNLYGYALNDPVNLIDLDGRDGTGLAAAATLEEGAGLGTIGTAGTIGTVGAVAGGVVAGYLGGKLGCAIFNFFSSNYTCSDAADDIRRAIKDLFRVRDAAGGSRQGPPGPKSKGICYLERDLCDTDRPTTHYCQYYCPQIGAWETIIVDAPCPPAIGFGN